MGVILAVIGALLLTPDTLLMRLSQLDGWNMLIWRGPKHLEKQVELGI